MFQSRNNSTVHLCPCILRESDHQAYYGGSQEWFERNTAYKGGCAAVCGANILSICAENTPTFQDLLGITVSDKRVISFDDYTRVLHELYNSIIMLEVPIISKFYDMHHRMKKHPLVPSTFGTNLPFFIIGVKKYAKSHGIVLNAHHMFATKCNYMRGLTFIKLALSNGHPVVLLTTNNTFEYTLYSKAYFQAGTTKKIKHHFVTITDIQTSGTKDNPDLVISNGGKTGKISYKDLHKSWQSAKSWGAGMAYFTPELNK